MTVHLMGGFGVARSPAGTDMQESDRPRIIDMRLTAEQVFGWIEVDRSRV
ncbi:MAG: hypothetical protein EBE86_029615 [Hormoscilla sp. GUM202]|nr:hypothetical protein [Hormoscilla sp. GUM202]